MARFNVPTDPFFNQQWHLHNTGQTGGTPGMDLNVLPVWQNYTGAGVRVGMIDDGVEYTHPDLDDNYDFDRDVDSASRAPDGAPVYRSDEHGTAVAGIIAAESANGIGGVGVAYDAALSSIRLDYEYGSIADIAFALRQMSDFDVVNNSWGYGFPFIDNFSDVEFTAYQTALQAAAETGRDGLGTVIVFAGGNSRDFGDSSNYHNLQNSRYSIAVGAVTHTGVNTYYSSAGANLLVSAFGGEITPDGIVTTDRQGTLGYSDTGYTSAFGGTSAAAPMVSGVAALMLEANPTLGYRDVQEILAYSARQTDTQNLSRQVNGAHNWNGGGLNTSIDYGFGVVDAHAAVRLAETWTTQHTAANEVVLQQSQSTPLSIPDETEVASQITLTDNLDIDRVEVQVNLSHSYIGDLELVLVSPTGTESILMTPSFATSYYSWFEDSLNFTFSSTQFWGENAAGDWTLKVRDRVTFDEGVLNNWTLNVYGDVSTPDDTYIYTDSFATVGADPARLSLQDSEGIDTLNAAAVTSNLVLDLNPGSVNTIAGRSLTIANDTQIEAAIGGDGNDRIRGNLADNTLSGERGNDILRGEGGNDRLLGKTGNDRIFGGSGSDRILGGEDHDVLMGNDGHDRLVGGAGNDRIVGGRGNDHLRGEAGRDILTGGAGRDCFVLRSGGQDSDRITDFVSGTDKIVLSKAIFSELTSAIGKGFDKAGEFAVVARDAAIATSEALIVYSQSSGTLVYNANGATSGVGTGGTMASLQGAPTLTAQDFILQA